MEITEEKYFEDHTNAHEHECAAHICKYIYKRTHTHKNAHVYTKEERKKEKRERKKKGKNELKDNICACVYV